MMRAEMVLRGHLSRDQYESLNAWASWYMNEKYPDPLAQCAEKFNSSAESTKAPTSGRGVGRVDDCGQNTLTPGQGFDSEATKAPTSGRGVERADDCGQNTLTPGQGFDSAPAKDASPAGPSGPTKLERLLASGRRLSPREQRRLEGLAARRRENCESTPTRSKP